MQFLIDESLVPTSRLRRVEEQLRKDYPLLPESAEFVTFRQPPTMAEPGGDGLVRPIPDIAVFGIVLQNPRYPESQRLFSKSTTLSAWRKWDNYARHEGEVRADPLYQVYRMPDSHTGKTLIDDLIDWDFNLRTMN